jgi:hypothetical protein
MYAYLLQKKKSYQKLFYDIIISWNQNQKALR